MNLREALLAAGWQAPAPHYSPAPRRRLGKVARDCRRSEKVRYSDQTSAELAAWEQERDQSLRLNSLLVYRCLTHASYHVGSPGGE